ncbi:hypothetical protein [Luteibacter yeojuensis]|uniref:hypothetical protein n=1 Tax=Luteibacter yeojuensis TaxID=345309 RepID=UPI000A8343E5|nr:hypothetical protein [Luteibacter yeojuensis]
MKIFGLVLAVILATESLSAGAASTVSGVWARYALQFREDKRGNYPEIVSPDRAASLAFTGDAYVFRDVRGVQIGKLPDYVSSPDLVEISWSPQGDRVFVNISDGGSSGTWHALVFTRTARGFEQLDVGDVIRQVSKLGSDCSPVNVGAVTWLEGGTQVLAVEQVPDVSRCADMGAASGYVVDIRKRSVARRLTISEVRQHFGSSMGTQARAATR